MRRFLITLAGILLICFGAFWLISVPHPWQTGLFRYTLFGGFLGVALMMALYHLFLYAFTERERAYLLYAATCFSMLARFVTVEGGVIALLMAEYPWWLHRLSLCILTTHGVFGIWFMHDTLRLPAGKAWIALYALCYLVCFAGPFVFARTYYLILGLVPNLVVIIKALRTPGVRKNPYRLALVAALVLFIVWTVLGVTRVMDGLFMAGLFPWMFFFFTQTVLLTVEFSETRQRERKMSESNALLENLSRVKSEFFSNISHEIKTPLTVIATDISLSEKHIRRGEYSEALQLLDNAHAEVMHTADYVADALRFARGQEAARTVERLDLGAVIKTVAAVFGPFASTRGNTIEIVRRTDAPAGGSDAPLFVYGNGNTLGHAVVNLLANANSHTKNSSIRVTEWVSGGRVTIAVRDNGCGIPAELLPHVFERGVTDGGGTGLGLTIVKSIVEQHGGEAAIESEPGKGTTASFTLPLPEEVCVCTER